MSRITRRAFAGMLVGGVALAAAVGIAILPLGPEERLRHLIRSRLDYLKIPDEVLNAFVRDYLTDRENRMAHVRGMRYVAARAAYNVPGLESRLPIHRFERHIISQFLLSTDFFRKGADVNRTLEYVAYPDPYQLGCANHLAKLA